MKSLTLAYNAASESITLKNKNSVLPIKNGAKILVTGPNANSMQALNGAWTYNYKENIQICMLKVFLLI